MNKVTKFLFIHHFLCSICSVVASNYPQDALSCYNTLSPRGKVICPRDRNHVCIKEEAKMGRGECGTTYSYQEDVWDRKLKQCVYRKCASMCPMRKTLFFNSTPIEEQDVLGNVQYERRTFCCNGDLCNNGKTLSWLPSFLAIVTLFLLFLG